jgi:CDGSH-type Zn-finger protein
MSNPVIAGRAPIVQDLQPGTRYWCACGKSKNQPFCDGSHAGTGLQPVAFTLDAPKRCALCACKQTKTQPMCDGSHKSLTAA